MTTPNDLGQKVMAQSMPVVLASDQSAVPIGGVVDVSDRPARQLGFLYDSSGNPLASTQDATDGQAGSATPNHLIVVSRDYMWDGSAGNWVRSRGDTFSGQTVSLRRSTATQAGNPAANTALTLTIPASGSGLFHFITHIYIARVATAALAGGTILELTTTNLGGIRWVCDTFASITGPYRDQVVDEEYVTPLRSTVSNTATTIVLPAPGAAVSWRAWVAYYIGS